MAQKVMVSESGQSLDTYRTQFLAWNSGLRILRWRNNIKALGMEVGEELRGRGITTGHTGQGNINQGLPRLNFTKPESSTYLFLGFELPVVFSPRLQ